MRNSSGVVDLNIASISDTARAKEGPKQGMGKAMPFGTLSIVEYTVTNFQYLSIV
jgi:hypothetical protein